MLHHHVNFFLDVPQIHGLRNLSIQAANPLTEDREIGYFLIHGPYKKDTLPVGPTNVIFQLGEEAMQVVRQIKEMFVW